MFQTAPPAPMRITPGEPNLLPRRHGTARNTLVLGIAAGLLFVVAITLTVLLFATRSEAADAAAKDAAEQTHLRDKVTTLTADRNSQRDRADSAESNLSSCSSAYNDQKSVTDDLRDAVRASYESVSVTLLGGADDTASILDEIHQINAREAAIDSSACEGGSNA